jgi:hypothetical protein
MRRQFVREQSCDSRHKRALEPTTKPGRLLTLPARCRESPARVDTLRHAFSCGIIDGMPYCEHCDMNREYCPHGLAEQRVGHVPRVTSFLLVSPRGMAHFPGCPHKGDDPDLGQWGNLELPRHIRLAPRARHARAGGPSRQSCQPRRRAMGRPPRSKLKVRLSVPGFRLPGMVCHFVTVYDSMWLDSRAGEGYIRSEWSPSSCSRGEERWTGRMQEQPNSGCRITRRSVRWRTTCT